MLDRLANSLRFASGSAALRGRRAAGLAGGAANAVNASTGARFALRGAGAGNGAAQARTILASPGRRSTGSA